MTNVMTLNVNFGVVTISGSMRHYPKMLELAAEYTLLGNIVLMPFCITRPDTQSSIKAMLDEMHNAKIARSNLVIVVGEPGNSTKREIEFAKRLSIPVIYREGITGA